MSETKEASIHGGDLDYIERNYNIARKDIIDFSGNINPLGFPEAVKKRMAENLDVLSTYPDKEYMELKKSIGQYVSAAPAHLILGNGATEIISLFMRVLLVKGGKSIIVVPAYSEYEREIQIVQGKHEYFHLKEEDGFHLKLEALLEKVDSSVRLLVMCNPNNPTGTAVYNDQMARILRHCAETNTFVMVDETYAEFTEDTKEISAVKLAEAYENLVVIRGISKFFAAPGLRLGYAICSNAMVREKINQIKDAWSVNSLADLAGRHLFHERSFIQSTKRLISAEREYIYQELSRWKNIQVFETDSNFILLKINEYPLTSEEIYKRLITKKMLIRDASSFVGLNQNFLRFCFLTPEQNRKLLSELKTIL